MWGSVLYGIMLFFFNGLSILLSDDYSGSYYRNLLSGEQMLVSMLMAIVVPSVVALLVFRYVHSGSQAIFTYSLPVTRGAGFVSAMLGALTLMLVPVAVNGLLLLVISKSGYGWYMSVADCFAWMGYNAMGLFMMFSCAAFAVSITGNAFSGIVINILLHSFLAIGVMAGSTMAEAFLHGFSYDNTLAEAIADNNFTVVLVGFSNRYFRDNLTVWDFVLYLGASALLLAASYVLFVKRKAETASEVAGFRCLNGIFKYTLTFLTALLAFGIFSHFIFKNPFGFAVIIFILSLIAYVVSEMLIRKTLNVFGAWKGYVCFCAVFGLMVIFFSCTSFFGYETRLPQKNETESVKVYPDHMPPGNLVDSEECIADVLDIHAELIAERHSHIVNPVFDRYGFDYSRINVKYRLKNGSFFNRTYYVERSKLCEIMDRLYASEAFRKNSEYVLWDDKDIKSVSLGSSTDFEQEKELLGVLRADTLAMSYGELHPDYDMETLCTVFVEYTYKYYDENEDMMRSDIGQGYIYITENYVKTTAWLRENGYLPEV